MPARALFDHGCQTKVHCLSPGVKRHIKVTPPLLACNGAVFPCLSAFACSTIHMSHTGRQYANMPKPQRRSKRTHWYWAVLPVYAIIFKAHNPHYFHFFFHYQASPLATQSAGELQIQIHLAALSGCSKLLLSILTLIGANEQHSHVLSKDPQTEGNIDSSHSFAVFHKRTDAMQSQVMTINFTTYSI